MKKFVIRDDDLNYFSAPTDIERWYGDIFAQGIPVGFASIPFVTTASDVFPHDREETKEEHPISGNKELIEYVSSNDLIDILQHGCTHLTVGGVFEYAKTSGLFEDTKRGKEELEKAFGQEVSVFVAPHNTYSNHAIRAVELAELNTLRGRGMKNFIPRLSYISGISKMILHKLSHFAKQLPPYPYLLNLKEHKEAYCCRLKDNNLDRLERDLAYIDKKGGIFVITNHIHNMNNQRRKNLHRLISLGKKLGFSFCKPSELF